MEKLTPSLLLLFICLSSNVLQSRDCSTNYDIILGQNKFDSNCNSVDTTTSDCTLGYGINVGKVEAYQSEWEFVNIAHHSLAWFPPNQQPTWNNWLDESQLTSDNYLPAGQSGILAVIWDAPIPINEDFVITYAGNAEVNIYPSTGIQVTAESFGRIEIRATNAKNLFLEVTADANEETSFIRVTKTAYENLNQVYSPEYLNEISHYSILRFVDFSEINDTEVTTLSDYTNSSSLFQDVVSIENIIKLANVTRSDPWINIPLQADDAFVLEWAQRIKNLLDPNLNVRVEFSNEVWNTAFPQHQQAVDLAHQLDVQNTDRPWEDASALYGYRSAQVHAIFESVFNSGGGDTPGLIKVLAWQAANSWHVDNIVLPFYRSVCGANCVPDELAIAPYFSHKLGSPQHAATIQTWNSDMLIDQILFANQLNGEGHIQLAFDQTSAYMDLINNEGIPKLSLYEGGQHLAGYAGVQNNQLITDLFIETNRSTRMQEVYTTYLNTLKSLGVASMCMYSSNGTFTKWGSWGLKEYIGQNESVAPKYLAYKNFIQANPTPQNCIDDCTLTLSLDDQLIVSGTYQAQQEVSSRNGIVFSPGDVTFRGNTIYLDKNFVVDQGATFLAEIAPCQ